MMDLNLLFSVNDGLSNRFYCILQDTELRLKSNIHRIQPPSAFVKFSTD